MSLDVYLTMRGTVRKDGSGLFVNDDGRIYQVTRDDWEEKFYSWTEPALNPNIDRARLLIAADFLDEHGMVDAAKDLRVLLREQPEECVLDDTVFSANITHNLGPMASEAGIYVACWRPGELLAPEIARRIREQEQAKNYHGKGGSYELERTLPVAHGKDLIEPLRSGLAKMRANRAHFEKFNSSNGWGLYENFVPWVQAYLDACEQWPEAEVSVSR